MMSQYEKLVYIFFWNGKGEDEAFSKGRNYQLAFEDLVTKKLIKKEDGIYQSDHAHLIDLFEKHNKKGAKLSKEEKEALMKILDSEFFGKFMEERLLEDVRLRKEEETSLFNEFWWNFRDIFAIAHAYFLVFCDQPSIKEIEDNFDDFLVLADTKKHWKKAKEAIVEEKFFDGDRYVLDYAFKKNFVFLFPRELVDYLRRTSDPSAFVEVAKDIFEGII
jgi:hypothetical protein